MGIVVLDMAMSLNGIVINAEGKSIYPIEHLRDTEALNEIVRTTGAVVMDREAYDMAGNNFLGYEYQVPIFVLTDEVPEKVAAGENEKLRFYFVTDGIDKAIEHARKAAGHRNVTVVGGVRAAHHCLRAGLLDEMVIRHIPVLLSSGVKLFDELAAEAIRLKITRSTAFANRIDIRYKILKANEGHV